MIHHRFIDDSLMLIDEYLMFLVDGTSLASLWINIESMNEPLKKHQRVINVNDVQFRMDASLMFL